MKTYWLNSAFVLVCALALAGCSKPATDEASEKAPPAPSAVEAARSDSTSIAQPTNVSSDVSSGDGSQLVGKSYVLFAERMLADGWQIPAQSGCMENAKSEQDKLVCGLAKNLMSCVETHCTFIFVKPEGNQTAIVEADGPVADISKRDGALLFTRATIFSDNKVSQSIVAPVAPKATAPKAVINK